MKHLGNIVLILTIYTLMPAVGIFSFHIHSQEPAESSPCAACPTSPSDLARGYALARAVTQNGLICVANRQKKPLIYNFNSKFSPEIDFQLSQNYSDWVLLDLISDSTNIFPRTPVSIYLCNEVMAAPQNSYCWGSMRDVSKVYNTHEPDSIGQEAVFILESLVINPRFRITEQTIAAVQSLSGTRPAFAINRYESISGAVAVASPLWVALERTSSTAARQVLLRAGYAEEMKRRKEHRGRWATASENTVFTYEDFVVEVLSQGATPSFRQIIAEAKDLATAYRAGTRLPLVKTPTGIAMRHYLLMQIAGQELPSFNSILEAVKKQKQAEAHPLPTDPSAYAVSQALADPASVILVGKVMPTGEHVVEYRGRTRTVSEMMNDPDLSTDEREHLVFMANTTIRLKIEEILKPGPPQRSNSATASAGMPALAVGGVVGVAMGLETAQAPVPGQAQFDWLWVGVGARIIILAKPPSDANPSPASGTSAAMRLRLPLLSVFGYSYHAIIDCQLSPDLKPFTAENFVATARARREARFLNPDRNPQPLPELVYQAKAEQTLSQLGGIDGVARPQWQATLSDMRALCAGAKPSATMSTPLGVSIQAFRRP